MPVLQALVETWQRGPPWLASKKQQFRAHGKLPGFGAGTRHHLLSEQQLLIDISADFSLLP